MTPPDCPRCGKSPVELWVVGDPNAHHFARCGCYPHKPKCIGCSTVLTGEGKCIHMLCRYYDLLQPMPTIDPLYCDDYDLS